jgi:hypothetical protein
MPENPRVRLADAITHFLLASIILLDVINGEPLFLRTIAFVLSMALAPTAAVIILVKIYIFIS